MPSFKALRAPASRLSAGKVCPWSSQMHHSQAGWAGQHRHPLIHFDGSTMTDLSELGNDCNSSLWETFFVFFSPLLVPRKPAVSHKESSGLGCDTCAAYPDMITLYVLYVQQGTFSTPGNLQSQAAAVNCPWKLQKPRQAPGNRY